MMSREAFDAWANSFWDGDVGHLTPNGCMWAAWQAAQADAFERANTLDAILCERLKRCVRVENKLINTAIGKLPPLDNAGIMALARELGTPT